MNIYRSEFLHSRAWFARRDRWFTEQSAHAGAVVCAACGQPGTRDTLELHHLDYAGVVTRDGRWCALEAHEDLVALHPYCHDLLHRLIDRDTVLSRHRTRRDATRIALDRLRTKLTESKETGP
jgi:hypothetical protein